MPVSPDVMDGVPEEPGYYFAKLSDNPVVWELYELSHVGGNLMYAEVCASDLDKNIETDEISDFTWSERIKPPKHTSES